MSEISRDYEVALVSDDDVVGILHVVLTDEGVVYDLFQGDDLIGTGYLTTDDLAEWAH